ncbi:hypothetical protein ADIS_1257 [Lunatimonas lonarensis]|uniref:Uncharacterized protein n=1 Tax=Lunatimonas lonarensis TaxID=1232681 RepID=R7ZWK9_9BACT|nr:hypothetical protein ADIS_1257 [Lunatimonas lonarensis]
MGVFKARYLLVGNGIRQTQLGARRRCFLPILEISTKKRC